MTSLVLLVPYKHIPRINASNFSKKVQINMYWEENVDIKYNSFRYAS